MSGNDATEMARAVRAMCSASDWREEMQESADEYRGVQHVADVVAHAHQ